MRETINDSFIVRGAFIMEYSDELVKLVEWWIYSHYHRFSFHEGVFEFSLKIKSKIQRISCRVEVHEKEIIVYGACPVEVDCRDSDMMAQMAEFLCRTNYRIKNGCFEFNFQDGRIRFRSNIYCENSLASIETINHSFYCMKEMYKDFSSGILDIIFAGYRAKEAFAKCEKSRNNALCSAID